MKAQIKKIFYLFFDLLTFSSEIESQNVEAKSSVNVPVVHYH